MNLAIPYPQESTREKKLRNPFAKLFSKGKIEDQSKKAIATDLSSDKPQNNLNTSYNLEKKKKIYMKLLKSIIDKVADILTKSDQDHEPPKFDLTEENEEDETVKETHTRSLPKKKKPQRICFHLNDGAVVDALKGYDPLRSGNVLNKAEIIELIKSMHENNLYYNVAKQDRGIRLNMEGIPYLDLDIEKNRIILKQKEKITKEDEKKGVEPADMEDGVESFTR